MTLGSSLLSSANSAGRTAAERVSDAVTDAASFGDADDAVRAHRRYAAAVGLSLGGSTLAALSVFVDLSFASVAVAAGVAILGTRDALRRVETARFEDA